MEELTDALGASFQVTKKENSIYAPHPRMQSYKQKTAYSGDQTTRRDRFLEMQKKKRFDYISHARKLALDEWSDEDDDKQEDDLEVEEMEIVSRIKPPKRYKDQLMLSEWLVDVPSDFEENWLMKICPVGKRNLVVAAKGRTCNYSKSGYCISSFSSALPGGNRSSCSGYTVLDCIYCEIEKTFYILDIMCWNQHPVYDCETEFRFFWLQSKMQDLPDKSEDATSNKFVVLPNCPCTKSDMVNELERNLTTRTDGVLFYHMKSLYTFGATPLVLWLKPDMLPNMLDIPLPQTTSSDMKEIGK